MVETDVASTYHAPTKGLRCCEGQCEHVGLSSHERWMAQYLASYFQIDALPSWQFIYIVYNWC